MADTETPSGNGGFDWSSGIEDIESLYAEEQAKLAAETEDGTGNRESNDDTPATETPTEKAIAALSDEQRKLVDEAIAAKEKALADAIASGDSNNGVYKGLQRVLAGRDQTVAEMRKALDEERARNAELNDKMSELGSGTEWLTETVLSALDPEARQKAERALTERQLKANQEEMKRLREERNNPPNPPQQQVEQPDSAQAQWIAQRLQAFKDSQRQMATDAGLDPDDSSLDYGTDDDAIVERSEKFNRSLFAAIRGKEVGEVRQTSKPALTRASGGANAPTSAAGGSRLERGANQIVKGLSKA